MRHGDVAAIERLVAADKSVLSLKDADGSPPRNVAAMIGNVNVARLLLEKGADPNAETTYGETPLWIARSSSFRAMPSEGRETVAGHLEDGCVVMGVAEVAILRGEGIPLRRVIRGPEKIKQLTAVE